MGALFSALIEGKTRERQQRRGAPRVPPMNADWIRRQYEALVDNPSFIDARTPAPPGIVVRL